MVPSYPQRSKFIKESLRKKLTKQYKKIWTVIINILYISFTDNNITSPKSKHQTFNGYTGLLV